MGGHHQEGPEVRARPAYVNASCLVLLVLGVVAKVALILNAVHPEVVVAEQQVTKPPVIKIVPGVLETLSEDPPPEGVGRVPPTPVVVTVIFVVFIGVIAPIITGHLYQAGMPPVAAGAPSWGCSWGGTSSNASPTGRLAPSSTL